MGFIIATILPLVLPSLATVLGGFLVAILNKFLKKQGIELTNAQDERLRQLVRDGIKAAEEMARRNPDLSSTEKKAIAANQAVAREPGTSIDTANRIVDQELPGLRKELAGTAKPQPSTPATFGRTN